MLREWRKLDGTKVNLFEQGWAVDDLTSALISCGDPTVIRRIGKVTPDHDVNTRQKIVNDLCLVEKDLRGKPLSSETVIAIEDLLIKLMMDMEQTRSYSSRGNKPLNEPALGDLATEALVGRWKNYELFDITAPFQVRARQRAEVKNVWLKKRGKEPVPVPPQRRIAPAPEAKVQPLLQAYVDAKSSQDRNLATKPIEDLGLSALPAVRKVLTNLKKDHPALKDMQALAARVALIVGEVHFAPDSFKPTDELRRKIEGLQGKPITVDKIMKLLGDVSAATPKGVRGVRITLERIGDDLGIYLVVTLIADKPVPEGLAPQLTYGSRITIDEKQLGAERRDGRHRS